MVVPWARVHGNDPLSFDTRKFRGEFPQGVSLGSSLI